MKTDKDPETKHTGEPGSDNQRIGLIGGLIAILIGLLIVWLLKC
jgi:hypothetical protein